MTPDLSDRMLELLRLEAKSALRRGVNLEVVYSNYSDVVTRAELTDWQAKISAGLRKIHSSKGTP